MNRISFLVLIGCAGSDDHGTDPDGTKTVYVYGDADTDSDSDADSDSDSDVDSDADGDADADSDSDGDADVDTSDTGTTVPPGLTLLWTGSVGLVFDSTFDFDAQGYMPGDILWRQLPDGIDTGTATWDEDQGVEFINGATGGYLSYPWGDELDECLNMVTTATTLVEPGDLGTEQFCVHTADGRIVVVDVASTIYFFLQINYTVWE